MMNNRPQNDGMLDFVTGKYGWQRDTAALYPLGNGLINTTWKLIVPSHEFVLQKVNHHVFADPVSIDKNLNLLSDYLHKHYPEYPLVAPVKATDGSTLVMNDNQEYFRVFPFVSGSHSKDVVETAGQAHEAAGMFGKFTRVLSGLDTKELHRTIPDFHNLDLRYQQFNQAITNGNTDRIREGEKLIRYLQSNATIVSRYRQLCNSTHFRLRVTHHDTKISNVLFNDSDRGLCVIDLDTVMPGYFISDVGDMMRTYLSPVGEEEQDFSKITVRDEFYEAIVSGYSAQMRDELTAEERDSFFYAGTFMIYMQALRFLTDYFNDDRYYGAQYPAHNLARAGNQVTLLQRLFEKQNHFLHAGRKRQLN